MDHLDEMQAPIGSVASNEEAGEVRRKNGMPIVHATLSKVAAKLWGSSCCTWFMRHRSLRRRSLISDDRPPH